MLQGVRDREAIKSSSEAEAEKAVAAVGLRSSAKAGRRKPHQRRSVDVLVEEEKEEMEEEEEEEEEEAGYDSEGEEKELGLEAGKGMGGGEAEELLPAMPTEEEDWARKVAAAEEEARSLQFLSKAVEERMLEEKFDNVRAPYREPRRPKPLPYQLDLLSYYAKEALRARNTTEAIRIYQRCACLPACLPA